MESLDASSIDEMSRSEAESRARVLRKALNRHDYLYYVENDPEIIVAGKIWTGV